jgi:hypothetical protein
VQVRDELSRADHMLEACNPYGDHGGVKMLLRRRSPIVDYGGETRKTSWWGHPKYQHNTKHQWTNQHYTKHQWTNHKKPCETNKRWGERNLSLSYNLELDETAMLSSSLLLVEFRNKVEGSPQQWRTKLSTTNVKLSQGQRNLLLSFLILIFHSACNVWLRDGASRIYQKKLHQIIFPKKPHPFSSCVAPLMAVWWEVFWLLAVHDFPRSFSITPKLTSFLERFHPKVGYLAGFLSHLSRGVVP